MVEIDAGDPRLPLDELGFGTLWLADDEELTILRASRKFFDMLGYGPDELTALHGRGQILQETNPVDWNMMLQQIAEQGYARVEMKLIRKDGHHIWTDYRMNVTEENGRRCWRGVVSDITLRRRSQRIQRQQKEELEALTANVPAGVLRCRADEMLTLDFVSGGFCRITGYSAGEIADRFGNHLIEFVYPSDREMLLSYIRGGENWKSLPEFTFRLVTKSGDIIWVMNKASRTVDSDGAPWIYSVLIDVTDTKKAQDELTDSEERYRLILEHVADPVFDCDFRTKEVYCSPTFRQKFPDAPTGNRMADVCGILRDTGAVYSEDRPAILQAYAALMNGVLVKDAECRLRVREGEYAWFSVHPTLFRDSIGRPTRLILMISDIDRQKRENLDLRRMAEHDLLTGLYNRVTTTSLVNKILADPEEDARHALFVLDIDNFKLVNDRCGHLCGDRLLADAAARIRAQFRDDDIVGRVGGDEFVVLMKNADEEAALKKAEMLNRIFLTLRNTENIDAPFSASVGVSIFPKDGKTYDTLFRKADTAMYVAKREGKNSFRLYVCEMGPGSAVM